jgi:hypothetical protein
MPRTAIPVTPLVLNGNINPVAGGVFVAGDFANQHSLNTKDGTNTWIHVKNTNAATRTVTVKAGPTTHRSHAFLAPLGDVVVTVAVTTGEQLIGPFESARFEQADGLIYVDIEAAAGVTLAAFQLPI